jgi:hypothetical protein
MDLTLKYKILTKLIYWWDVLFTAIDIWQLKVYMKMIKTKSNLNIEKNVKNKIKQEDFDTWEDIK